MPSKSASMGCISEKGRNAIKICLKGQNFPDNFLAEFSKIWWVVNFGNFFQKFGGVLILAFFQKNGGVLILAKIFKKLVGH